MVIYVVLLVFVGLMDQKDWVKFVVINVIVMGMLIFYILLFLGVGLQVIFFDDVYGGEKFYGVYGVIKVVQIVLVKSWQVECMSIDVKVLILMLNLMLIIMWVCFFSGEDCDVLVVLRDEVKCFLIVVGLF